MTKLRTDTYNQQLQRFFRLYREQVKDGPITLREVAAWAIREGLWAPPVKSAVDQLARDLGQAARVEYLEDFQGRRVRKLHARRMKITLPSGEVKQETFWDDITTATPAHMLMAFQQRRRLVLSDCHQLKTDVDSYNENWNEEEQLEVSYDFTEDLEELEMPSEYEEPVHDSEERL